MSDNPLSTNPILPADAHARYVPWLTDVDREIGCLVRVALQRDYSFLAAFHRGLSVPEAIREAIPWLRHCNESTPSRSSPKTWRTCFQRTWPSPREQRPRIVVRRKSRGDDQR